MAVSRGHALTRLALTPPKTWPSSTAGGSKEVAFLPWAGETKVSAPKGRNVLPEHQYDTNVGFY